MRKRFDKKMQASLAGVWIALALGGCANFGQQNAQNSAATGTVATAGVPATNAGAATDASAESAQLTIDAHQNAALKKSPPLVYRVRRGDTLARVAQRHHCSVKQLQAWNGLKASARLKPGQVLQVWSPETARQVKLANAKAAAAAKAAVGSTPTPAPAPAATQTPAQASTQAAPAPNAATVHEVMQETNRHASSVTLAWPPAGSGTEAFQPGETRGIEIGGKPGDPVRAAADGKVMYAGTGLNGYGSLITGQHNKVFLTAFPLNRKLLVGMGDGVRQGQQIAEVGDKNNSRVSVGFE